VDLNAFVETRRPSWRRLELLITKLEAHGARALVDADVARLKRPKDQPGSSESDQPAAVVAARELAQLYREACADLIRARSETANAELIGYLNGLVGRAYGVIYRGRVFRPMAFLRFVLVTVPALIRARWRYVAAAAAFFFAGTAFAWISEALDPTAKQFFLPPNYAKIEEQISMSNPATGGTALPPGVNALMATGIMTNNIGVSFFAFALGITGGIGTSIALFYNGILLGCLAAVFARHNLSVNFWAFILPHGVIELTAIFIAGGAGFLLGRALIAPGDLGRRQSLLKHGFEAIQLAVGCALLLIPAGLIEGFVTPQPMIPSGGKIAFGIVTGIVLLVYFVWNEDVLDSVKVLEPLGGSASTQTHSGPGTAAPGRAT
jgi:uncharacterized membrane protein SpoIIM required for sporulation